MKVNNIHKYNTSPQFKALRIVKKNSNYLSTLPDKVINKLDSIGQYLSNTKFYHLDIINNEYYISHINGERLYHPYLVINAGKSLIIKSKQGLSQITKKLNYQTNKEVNQICERIKAASTQMERTAEIIKCLDDYESNCNLKNENIIISNDNTREDKIQKLIKKYGV